MWETLPTNKTLQERAQQGLVYMVAVDFGSRNWVIVCLATEDFGTSEYVHSIVGSAHCCGTDSLAIVSDVAAQP